MSRPQDHDRQLIELGLDNLLQNVQGDIKLKGVSFHFHEDTKTGERFGLMRAHLRYSKYLQIKHVSNEDKGLI